MRLSLLVDRKIESKDLFLHKLNNNGIYFSEIVVINFHVTSQNSGCFYYFIIILIFSINYETNSSIIKAMQSCIAMMYHFNYLNKFMIKT